MADIAYNRKLGHARLTSVYFLVLLLLYLAMPTPLGVTLGGIIVLVGESLRFWAAGHLLKTHELVTSGPYRYTRNPLYLGRLLIFSGLCVMARLPYGLNWGVLVVDYAIFFGYYLPRKERVEPARLLETHGEAYRRYFEAVPALRPTLTPYPETPGSGWSSERAHRNREHWMVAALLVITLILLWKSYRPSAAEPMSEGTTCGSQHIPSRGGHSHVSRGPGFPGGLRPRHALPHTEITPA